MRRSAVVTASAFIGLASIVAAGTSASASAKPAVAPKVVAASSFTLNLLGAPLVIDITTDPAGNLVNVGLNPANVQGLVPTAAMPHKVKFENTLGTMAVSVKANHGGQSVTARGMDLAAVSGPGIWTGDVFGLGTSTTVNFVIGLLADGVSPDITGVAVVPACGAALPAVQCTIMPTTYGEDDDDDEGAMASASVKFSNLGQTRTLRIRVGLHTDDGETKAVVRISLGKIKGAMSVVVGSPQVWTGTLCDGLTVATFGYQVDATTGAVTITTPPTPTAEIKNNEHGVEVRFADGPRVRIGVKHDDDGPAMPGLTVKYRCRGGVPTINGAPADPTIVSQGGHGGDDHGDDGGHGGGHGGDDKKNNG